MGFTPLDSHYHKAFKVNFSVKRVYELPELFLRATNRLKAHAKRMTIIRFALFQMIPIGEAIREPATAITTVEKQNPP